MLNTCAAAPESLPADLLDDATAQPSDLGMMQTVLDAIPSAVVILDSERQIFFANRAAARLAGKLGHTDVQGMRVGEMLACRNLNSAGSGCGTERGCRTCGERAASLAALRGQHTTTEQRITTQSGDCHELQLTASPFVWQGDDYALLVLTDISAEKRREMLERVLFQDVLSMATGVSGLLAETAREPSLYPVIKDDLVMSSQALVNEIKGQQQLLDAESGNLVILPEPVAANHLLHAVREACQFQPAAMGKEITLEADLPSFVLRSDPSLLKHILGNLLRNALEATLPGTSVRLGAARTGAGCEFWCWNEGVIPAEIQRQIFQRGFSTKGSGRGIGTYSLRLFVEVYLGGRVDFTSTKAAGTRFFLWLPMA
jgi:signal transduction histidine kinase